MKWRKLGRKQTEDNDYWLDVYDHITDIISQEHVETLIEATIAEIKRTLQAGWRVGYAWSGGKDSQALRIVMERMGISRCVFGMSADMEYPAILRWVTDHMPFDLDIIDNPDLTLRWLGQLENEKYIFPQDSPRSSFWFQKIQHRAQDIFFQRYKLDVLLMGRRHGDSNYTGKNKLYTSGKGTLRYSPICDWSHEEVMAACHYCGYDLPPTYTWPNGWVVGSGAWPARQFTRSVDQGWYETLLIDPSLVERATQYVPAANDFLERYPDNVRIVRFYRPEGGRWRTVTTGSPS